MLFSRVTFLALFALTATTAMLAEGSGLRRHRVNRCCEEYCDYEMQMARRQTVGQMGAFLTHLKALVDAEKLSAAGKTAIDAKFAEIMGAGAPPLRGLNTQREDVEAALNRADRGGFAGELVVISNSLRRLQGNQ